MALSYDDLVNALHDAHRQLDAALTQGRKAAADHRAEVVGRRLDAEDWERRYRAVVAECEAKMRAQAKQLTQFQALNTAHKAEITRLREAQTALYERLERAEGLPRKEG